MGLRPDVTKAVEVPGEAGETVTIRMISWLTLDKAKDVRQRDLAATAAAMLTVVDKLVDDGKKRDRFLQYDKLTLLKHGIVAWTYDAPVDPERLDPATAEHIARAILDYASPEPPEVKGDASPSISS